MSENRKKRASGSDVLGATTGKSVSPQGQGRKLSARASRRKVIGEMKHNPRRALRIFIFNSLVSARAIRCRREWRINRSATRTKPSPYHLLSLSFSLWLSQPLPKWLATIAKTSGVGRPRSRTVNRARDRMKSLDTGVSRSFPTTNNEERDEKLKVWLVPRI